MLIGNDKIGWITIDTTSLLHVEQYGLDELGRVCVEVWGDKGAKRYTRLLEELRKQRLIVEWLAAVTTSSIR